MLIKMYKLKFAAQELKGIIVKSHSKTYRIDNFIIILPLQTFRRLLLNVVFTFK